ncbi:hypothetical protein WJX73_009633 [Symbiochloris irregularis]|uniref:Glycosyl hydrolase family 32 N-terminal domain-containing protein n=1 Tax=Symbiochloris irregularis TaxID=706552 RepID=A0AAW1NSR9_9CHLO
MPTMLPMGPPAPLARNTRPYPSAAWTGMVMRQRVVYGLVPTPLYRRSDHAAINTLRQLPRSSQTSCSGMPSTGNAWVSAQKCLPPLLLVLLMAHLLAGKPAVPTPGCNNSGTRVAVVTLATQGAYEATLYASMINMLWAHRHGYDFYKEGCVPDSTQEHAWDYHDQHRANWAKPHIIAKHLKTHHLVLYIDADAHVADPSMTVEEYVEANMPDDKLLLAPKNCRNGYCWDDIPGVMGINTGALIARHAPATFSLLHEWGEAWNGTCKDWAFAHPREQACLGILYANGKNDSIHVVEDIRHFVDENGTWFHHAMSMTLNKSEIASQFKADLIQLMSPDASPPQDTAWQKFASNPVLKGDNGVVFDMDVIRQPNGTFSMWLSWRDQRSIALTTSEDGISWSPVTSVLGSDSGSDWEDDVNRPCVRLIEGKYHMWYTGQLASQKSAIGYAVSTDGIEWQRQAEPVLTPVLEWEGPAVMNPVVIFDKRSSTFRMWYSAGEQYEPVAVGYATSKDGITWERHSSGAPIFSGTGHDGDWDSARASVGQVVLASDWHYMFYMGYSNVDHSAIGIARSRDGITNWERNPTNPILDTQPGAWDEDAVYKPAAVFRDDQWFLWYNGRRGGLEQIGLATFSGHELWNS